MWDVCLLRVKIIVHQFSLNRRLDLCGVSWSGSECWACLLPIITLEEQPWVPSVLHASRLAVITVHNGISVPLGSLLCDSLHEAAHTKMPTLPWVQNWVLGLVWGKRMMTEFRYWERRSSQCASHLEALPCWRFVLYSRMVSLPLI
jgi:hypothetical protein